MRKIIQIVSILSVVAVFYACSHYPNDNHLPNNDLPNKVTIEGIIIQNKTPAVITDVKVDVPSTRSNIACSLLLPNRSCSLGFKIIQLENHPATLNWTQGQRRYNQKIQAESIPTPSTKAFIVYVDIYSDGHLDTYFK